MAEDEGVGSRGFLGRKERAQAIQLLGSDWVANHLLDCGAVFSQVKLRKQLEPCLLMTSIESIGQATLSGSFLTTSAVLKIPWMEHALTLNW